MTLISIGKRAAVVAAAAMTFTGLLAALPADAGDSGDAAALALVPTAAADVQRHIIHDGVYFRRDPYGASSGFLGAKNRGYSFMADCKLKNKYGNLWIRTEYLIPANQKLYVYSGHVSEVRHIEWC